ncbi:MAG: hypothetical protein AAGG54_05005 [Pseudomonadota bacterium]
MRRLFLTFLFAFCPFASLALTPDDIRKALDEGDFAALETHLSTAHQTALEDSYFVPLRAAYGRIFAKLHAERFDAALRWHETYPSSPYAATALAKMHLQRAFAIRGEYLPSVTPPAAFHGFKRELGEAVRLAEIAYGLAPDFVPAIDILLNLRGVLAVEIEPFDLIEQAFALAPQVGTIYAGQQAFLSGWIPADKSFAQNELICARYADRVPGYDAEACWIELILTRGMGGDARERALAALDTRDETQLDYLRYHGYVGPWKDRPEAEERAYDLHYASLQEGIKPAIFLERLSVIEARFNNLLYRAEAVDGLYFEMLDRLEDDPQNPELRFHLIRDIIRRVQRGDPYADLDEAWAHWLETLPLASHRHDTWDIGDQIAFAKSGAYDIEARLPFIVNMVVSGNHAPRMLSNAVFRLHTTYMSLRAQPAEQAPSGDEREAVLRAIACPMLQAARLWDTQCSGMFAPPGCHKSDFDQTMMDNVHMLSREIEHCDWVQHAEPEALLFSPLVPQTFD